MELSKDTPATDVGKVIVKNNRFMASALKPNNPSA